MQGFFLLQGEGSGGGVRLFPMQFFTENRKENRKGNEYQR